MIRLEVIGHLGNDAKIKKDKEKTTVSFSVAHSIDKEKTQWVNCFLNWETKVAEYLKKGTKVCCIGRPAFSVYEGEVSISLTLIDNPELLSSKD